jgi:hypothetical protein
MLGKRLINSNSAAAGGPCTTDTLQILGDTSCIAYYKMSDATDESGNYDGTASNVNFNVAGKFGNSGEFNGSSSQIELPFNPIGTNLIGSISLWLKGASFGNSAASTDIAFYNRNPYVLIDTYQNNLRVIVKNSSSSNTTISYALSNFNTSDWYNIAVVLTGVSSTFTLYVNGSSVGTATAPSSTKNVASTALIGLNSATWNGSIDQVRIFNKSLSSSEVTTLYNEVQCVPTIVPTDNFNTVLYNGNGSSQNIDTVGFQPDFTFIKNRNAANPNALFDSVRGAGKLLVSNTTAIETGNSGDLLGSFRPLGFQVNRSYLTNTAYDTTNGLSNLTYVAWNWKAGGAEVTNTDGTVDGQVSANVAAGFSIVKSTYTSTANYTVGHGLSQRPEIVFNKNVDDASGSYGQWWTWIEGVTGTNGDYIRLNGTGSKNAFSDTFTTNTTIKYHTGFQVTGTNKSMISYAFHSVDGYSKIGSYVGNDSTDGPNIVTGFRPAFVMFKATNATGGNTYWVILDNKRDGVNTKRLYANASFAEDPAEQVDFLSNGFKIKTNNSDINSNFNYMFLAFAE